MWGRRELHFHVVLAENLAAAATPTMHWRRSGCSAPGHRANILDPRLNEIVETSGMVRQGGYLWAVEDFSAAVAVVGLLAD